jgi:MFS-type transporter involved in bile tolerance (Atg22 family)
MIARGAKGITETMLLIDSYNDFILKKGVFGRTLRTEELYVSLAVTAVLGIIFNFLIQYLTRYFVPWQAEHRI